MDFKGRRIVDKGDAWRRLLKKFLKLGGLSLDDVTLVKRGFDMAPFYNDEVDIWAGFLTSEVIIARQKGFELVTFPVHEYGFSSIGSSIYTSEKMIARNPQTVESFLIASIKGWNYAIQNIEESIGLMIDLFPKMASEKQFHRFSFEASIPLIIPPGKKVGHLDCNSWKNNPIFSNLTHVDRLYDTRFLENAWRKLEIK